MKKEMLINVLQPEECRIAIVEDGVLEELYVERTSHESYVGNVYKGRIVNIEPSIQAAFVDFGVGRNGFLHVSDVEPAYYRHLEGYRGEAGDRRGSRDRFRGPAPRRPRRGHDDDKPELAVTEDWDDAPGTESGPAASEKAPEGPNRRRGRGRPRRGRRQEPPHLAAPLEQPFDSPQSHEAGDGWDRFPPDEADQPRDDLPPEPPHIMGSAERRTEEDEPPVDPVEPTGAISDADLFFPRSSEAGSEPPSTPTYAAEEPEPEIPLEPPPVTADDREEDFSGEEDEEAEPLVVGSRVADFEEEEREPMRRRPRGRDSRGRPRGRDTGRGDMFGRPKPLIQDIFKRGQEVLVQVIKEGIGTKGPTLSTYISIAGRYLVLMPGLNRIGVSRKIADDEQRRRLREILHDLQPPKGLGFIIRTAGLDRTKKELQRDLAYLSRLWQVVVRRIRKLKGPAEIYQESDMITRTIRDTFTNEIDGIWVDEKAAFEHAQEFLQIVMPRYAARIKLYDDSEPMFHKHGIEKEIAKIQQRHVPLPHGGSIVIDQTEALVAIDVNSGNFRADNNAEETAYQMNLQAAKEIARQLRLRDLGGVIVNDFIDMRDDKHRRAVERALREAVKRDRARTKILRISAFGIIEMTRQRIRPSLKRSVYQDCPHCLGTGQVKTCESMSIDVMRTVQLAAHHENVQRIQIRVAEDVAQYLLNKKRKEIARLEEERGIQVNIHSAPGLAPETLDFQTFDKNNNEVKVLPYEEPPTRRGR